MRPSRSCSCLCALVLTLAFLFVAGLSLQVGAATGPAEDRAGLQPEENPSPAAGELDKSLEATLFLVPNDLTAINAENATPIHDYGSQRLMAIAHVETLSQATRNRLTSLDDPHSVFYRNCRSSVLPLPSETVATLPDGYYLLALIGPADETWRKQIASFGVVVVDTAAPYGLVVHATGRQLLGALLSVATSQGYPVICGIAPIPLETRLSGELLRILKGEQALRDISGLRLDAEGRVAVRLFFFNDPTPGQRPLDHRAAQLVEVKKIARIAPSDLAYGYDDAVLMGGPGDIARILRDIPSVAYMEAIHERQTDDHAQVYYPIAMAVSPPLYTIQPIVPKAAVEPRLMPDEEIPPWINGRGKPGPTVSAPTENFVLQDWVGTPSMPSPISNFEGLGTGLAGFSMTGAPPDTEGDVGPNHYVQWVNSMFAIFNKSTGTVLYGPANGNTLFTPLGGNCAAYNNGDPLVMYDRIADRWFMSQFAISGTPYTQCVAVSKTNDPTTSGWNLYAFSYGTNFNDYGKSGVWPDGYYIMYHMFANGSAWAGTEVCVFDRVKMLAGQVATQQCFGPNANYGGLLPSHLQGSTLPPAGSRNYFMAFGNSGQLLFWPFHVDWTTPANTTFPFNSPTTISVASFTLPCGDTGGTCVPQPGTSNQLDTLGDRLMWRMNYRNFGTFESLVLNHSVTGGAGTGVRWYEIRTPATTPTVYQQGTFAPADTTWRWMGSIDMDKNGDIAVGYSGSSASPATLKPSLFYTGRLVGDTPGTFGQGESTLFTGTGSQTGTLSRWGDYSTMSIDPTDDCTFWFTSEYLASNGTFNWHTRIGSFRFPTCCTTPGAPSLTSATGTCIGVTLNWTAGTGTTSSYNVYRSSNTSCPVGTLTKLNASPVPSGTLTYNDTTAVAGTAYTYVVRGACDTGGVNESGNSNCLAAARLAAPSAPAAPTFTSVACTTLTVNWSAVSGATAYDVYRVGATSCTGAVKIASTSAPTVTYNDSALAANSPYSYFVIAKNACGSSPNGTCNTATTLAAAYCSVPGEVAPGSSLATAESWTNKNTQAWPAVTGAQSYNIYYGLLADLPALTSSTADSCLHGNTSATSDATFTEDPSAKAGRFYWYLITAVNLAGEGTAGTYNTTGTPTARVVNLKAGGSCPP